MTEYVDRNKVIDEMANICVDGTENAKNIVRMCLEIVVDSIKLVPAADVEKVRRGHWIYHRAPNRIADDDYCECSLCGRHVYEDALYCPGCGAKCDGEMVYQ